MPSRMEKYYKTSSEVKQRTRKNEDLYKSIYDVAEYSNIEGITSIEKTDEIDLVKIKELINNREEYNQERERRRIVKEPRPVFNEVAEPKEEEKNYDIRDVLNKAKGQREEDKENYHSLRNTQYNILKGLKLKEKIDKEEYFDSEEELKELINTITSTSILNKLEDKELSLNILDELKANGDTMIGNSKSIRSIIEENSEGQNEEEEESIDKSFYTSSLNFKEEDFDELKDISDTLKRNNILIKILLFILLIIIITGTGFVVYNFLI